MYRPNRPFDRHILTVCLLLLAGCGQPPPTPKGAGKEVVDNTEEAKKAIKALKVQLGTSKPYVGMSEFQCITQDFYSYFQLFSTQAPIVLHSLQFNVQDLVNSLPPGSPGLDRFRGVEVYFGLDEQSEFDVAIEPVILTYHEQNGTYAVGHGATYYRIIGGSLVDQHHTIDKWQNEQGKRYTQDMMVQLDGSSPIFERFKNGRDVTSVVFSYDHELESLINDNHLMNGMLEIRPMCEPFSRDSNNVDHDRRQGVCVVPVGIPLTDVFASDSLFYQKAADLGSPCPPTCGYAVFRTTGLTPRPGC